MMMDAECGLACVIMVILGLGVGLAAALLTLGGLGRRLKARRIVGQLRARGVRASDAIFYGSPGEGWLAVTVNADDPRAAPYHFQVPDREATFRGVIAEWERVRRAA